MLTIKNSGTYQHFFVSVRSYASISNVCAFGSCRLCVIYITLDGKLSTYDESVLKLSKVSFRRKWPCTGHSLKIPSPKKLARLSHFPPASQTGRLASPVFCTVSFLWSNHWVYLEFWPMPSFRDKAHYSVLWTSNSRISETAVGFAIRSQLSTSD